MNRVFKVRVVCGGCKVEVNMSGELLGFSNADGMEPAAITVGGLCDMCAAKQKVAQSAA